ncbi:3-phosphoshikimate 1-carboxyvinyltransferase [Alicyclobacillus macrosporangiidus]|uniref:3-phosphoshikimate 1-carboxyvinyltransferase n=1 Tax=Alicyclobacillus macrosporangiidus TaxID=392015 RepID=UPI000AB4E289|nr:3-phosphoshikimate 1-carboxyvinyltransferase [Alicyclobacillus macrosporangiidus]
MAEKRPLEQGMHCFPGSPLRGTVAVPGDKSITHRAILFGLLAAGRTEVSGWLDAGDCRSSLRVARMLGAEVAEADDGRLVITGTGGHLREPEDVLDCGNSGTTMRVFLGAIAARVPFAVLTGDGSLRRRPMRRVIDPLTDMGAAIYARSGRFAPLAVEGRPLRGIDYTLPVASAQVKSAILVAGLLAHDGVTAVTEPEATRDHTENLLTAFGVHVKRTSSPAGNRIEVEPGQVLRGAPVAVPGDPSSAAFLIAAAALVPGSAVTVTGVGLNATRTGFLRVLGRMGARIELGNLRKVSGEVVGDITVTHGPLTGVEIEPAEVPSLIDELPVLAVLAAFAEGTTRVRGAAELRVKETDRIAAVAEGLRAMGVLVDEAEDGFTVYGRGMVDGGVVDSHGDHRIAMSFAVAGLASRRGVTVHGWDCVNISYPTFAATLEQLGASLQARPE